MDRLRFFLRQLAKLSHKQEQKVCDLCAKPLSGQMNVIQILLANAMSFTWDKELSLEAW